MHAKKKFLIFSIFIFLFIFEFLSFIYFRIISNDITNLKYYSEKRESVSSVKYFKNIGLVLYEPKEKKDLVVTHYTKEFVDRYIFRDILDLGFGLPDDGIDDRKFKAIAIGDSFTKGVGSLDNLKNGWVELVEKKNKDIDIINLGGAGTNINSQKYHYDKIKNLINHDIIIYNFLSTSDYFQNLDDYAWNLYVQKYYEKFGKTETQALVDGLNFAHGYKNHLEYLLNNKFRSYLFYFLLKTKDYFFIYDVEKNAKRLQNKLPQAEGRLNIVEDELYVLAKLKNNYKNICKKKYCYPEIFKFNKEIINEAIFDKIILNSADKINQFHEESLSDNKKFIFVLHSDAGHFYSAESIYDNNKIDEKLIKLLDPRIKVVNVSKKLFEINDKNKEKTYFYKNDGHYNIEGYKTVGTIISTELSYLLK